MIIGYLKPEMIERIKAIRADFARLYNLEKLRQELFDEQSGLCAVCKERLQSSDGVVTAIDHSTSVFIWAESQISIDEASRHANDRNNLQAVHCSCNSAKRELDLIEFTERVESGHFSLSAIELLTPETIQKLRDDSRRERVIFLVTKKELEAIDNFAEENYFGNRTMVIRQALIDFGLFKKASK